MLLRKPQNYEQMVNRGRHGENLVPVFPCDWPGRDLLVLEYCQMPNTVPAAHFPPRFSPDWFVVFVQ